MSTEAYVPGGVAGLLRKKDKKKKNVEDLSNLFTVSPAAPIEGAEKTKKKKKRKNSEMEVEGEAKKKISSEEEVTTAKKKKKKKNEADGIDTEEKSFSGAKLVHETETKKGKHPERRKKSQFVDDIERRKRTVFVGNVPAKTERKAIKRLFKEFGEIETVRLRSAAPVDQKTPKKVAVIKNEFHPSKQAVNAYIVFKEMDNANKALKMNGFDFDGHHLRVDIAFTAKQHDHRKSVFIGNLPFNAQEDALRTHFNDCGTIDNVRVIRDKKTGMGKGFGYIKFQDNSGVDFALQLDGQAFENRQLRVKRSNVEEATKKASKTPQTEASVSKVEVKKKKLAKIIKKSNETQGSFIGAKADSLEKLKKKKKKLKKKKQLKQKDNKFGDKKEKKEKKVKKTEGKPGPKKKKDFKKKVFASNRIAKKQRHNGKK